MTPRFRVLLTGWLTFAALQFAVAESPTSAAGETERSAAPAAEHFRPASRTAVQDDHGISAMPFMPAAGPPMVLSPVAAAVPRLGETGSFATAARLLPSSRAPPAHS